MDELTKASHKVAEAIIQTIAWHTGSPPPTKFSSDQTVKRELTEALEAFGQAVANKSRQG